MKSKYILMKNIECPICNKTTKQPALRSTLLKVIKQDFDLGVLYENIEPLFYGVWFCNHCGYANLTQNFKNPREKKYSYENIHNNKWIQREVKDEYNIDEAITLYKLVLLNKTTISKQLLGEIGVTCLKLYYLYKLKNNEQEMKRFRMLCLDSFKKAYQSEEGPFGGYYNSIMIEYLISIFSYDEGDIETAKKWISRVISNRNTPDKLKEKARDFKENYLI